MISDNRCGVAAESGMVSEFGLGRILKKRDVLLIFFDFPAEHWRYIRTSSSFVKDHEGPTPNFSAVN